MPPPVHDMHCMFPCFFFLLVKSPYSVLDLPVVGAAATYRSSTTLLKVVLSSTFMPVIEYPLLEAICVAIEAETTWMTQCGGFRACCTYIAFQALTSFADAEWILGTKLSTFCSALQPPLPQQPLAFAFCWSTRGF